jgi:hypothetical protein
MLAQSNKTRTRGQSDKEAQKRYRQRGAIACTANGKTLYGSALPVFPAQPPGKQDVDHCSNEHICDGRGVLRFGVHAGAKSRGA